MTAQKKPNTVEIATALMKPIVDELGLYLWDVRFEKEGSQWYLRYFIDKDEGITIQECEQASRAVDKLLDETDPIKQSYILEVGSPGVDRELVKDWHFERYLGHTVQVRLIRPVDNQRDFCGELLSKEGHLITLALDDETQMEFLQQEAAFVRLAVELDFGGAL